MRKRWRFVGLMMAVAVLSCFMGATPAYANVGDDTMDAARTISVNSTYEATTVKRNDPDWYRFSLGSDGPAQIVFDNDQHSSGSWNIYLKDSEGTDIYVTNFEARAAHHEGTKIGLSAGTYYVMVGPVWGFGDCTGYNYRLTIGHSPSANWETEINDDIFESSDSIDVNETIQGTTHESSDVDWYRFTLSEASPVQIVFNNEQRTNGSWLVYLEDSDSETILSERLYAKEASHEMEEVTLSAGTYYVRVLPVASWGSVDGLSYSLTVRASALADEMVMYRLYNPNTGEHFYTSSVSERNMLSSVGWKYEGVGWIAPTSGDPVYRLYNRNAPGGDHHYTTSAAERDQLVSYGWKYEGVGWYSGGSVPLYRQYNPNAASGTHNYTVDKAENDRLVAAGWKYEGVAWYALRSR